MDTKRARIRRHNKLVYIHNNRSFNLQRYYKMNELIKDLQRIILDLVDCADVRDAQTAIALHEESESCIHSYRMVEQLLSGQPVIIPISGKTGDDDVQS